MAAEGVANGGFFTTGEFTTEALAFAEGKNLDLVDGREFLKRIQEFQGDVAERLLVMAQEGNYFTPTCPSCGIKMVKRISGKGRSAGDEFWGCKHYPRCRQTFKMCATEE